MKNRKQLFVRCFALLLLFSNSLYANSKPDWVEGEAGFYPNQQFITATGSASNAELAKSRALGNLSKVFETHVRESSTTKSDTNIAIVNGNENFTKQQRLSQQIQLDTDKIIKGARIAENWKDGLVFTYHALAVLDRKQAGNNIRDEMQRIDTETKSELQRSDEQADVLLAMAALDSAVLLQTERQVLQASLKVIDTQGHGLPSKWNLAELKGRLENKLQSLEMGADVDSDPIGNLQASLKSAMGNAGFAAGNGTSHLKLVASLDVRDLGLNQGWYWARGTLTIKMVEENGKIRGRKQWLLKVSALQQSETNSRMMTQVSKKLNADLKSTVIEFATGVN